MNHITRPAIVLLSITVVAAFCLGIVSEITKAPIAQQEIKAQQEAMQKVLPDAESFEEVQIESTATIKSVNAAVKGGEVCGYVVNVTPSGFGGVVSTMVGVNLDGTISGVTVLSHSETPGLGARCTEEGEGSLMNEFAGKTAPVAVTKDGGEIHAITSATITSRAVTSGVNEACDWVAANGGAK